MKIAIMQPYTFPYIGYFQLIKAVNQFIFFDDVNFINRSWINRNNILVNSKKQLFTIPLHQATQNKLIKNTYISYNQKWQIKLLKTIEYNYKKAPYFSVIFQLIKETINKNSISIADLAILSIKNICKYLQISTHFLRSSELNYNCQLKSVNKIIAICKKQGATNYINLSGGKNLYLPKVDLFLKNNLELSFLSLPQIKYTQFNSEFIPFLSILDVLMFNSPYEANQMIHQYSFS